jgi:hypothetical protein
MGLNMNKEEKEKIDYIYEKKFDLFLRINNFLYEESKYPNTVFTQIMKIIKEIGEILK